MGTSQNHTYLPLSERPPRRKWGTKSKIDYRNPNNRTKKVCCNSCSNSTTSATA